MRGINILFYSLITMRNKSDVPSSFIHFKSMAENRFSTSIKEFQCDNGGEYLSQQFKNLLRKSGIHQRLSCPYTSQQNGLAERKHRHTWRLDYHYWFSHAYLQSFGLKHL